MLGSKTESRESVDVDPGGLNKARQEYQETLRSIAEEEGRIVNLRQRVALLTQRVQAAEREHREHDARLQQGFLDYGAGVIGEPDIVDLRRAVSEAERTKRESSELLRPVERELGIAEALTGSPLTRLKNQAQGQKRAFFRAIYEKEFGDFPKASAKAIARLVAIEAQFTHAGALTGPRLLGDFTRSSPDREVLAAEIQEEYLGKSS